MAGFCVNIEVRTSGNTYFRQVLYTAPHCQLAVMTLQSGEEIGLETHNEGDQFIRVESGQGIAFLNGEQHVLSDGMSMVIPAGTEHNVVNTSDSEPLRLTTLYAPPEHPEGTVHRTKQEADAAKHAHG